MADHKPISVFAMTGDRRLRRLFALVGKMLHEEGLTREVEANLYDCLLDLAPEYLPPDDPDYPGWERLVNEALNQADKAVEHAGCYPRNAKREHPGPLALNPPPPGVQCGRDVGSRPGWMSPDQYDPCPCVLGKGHSGDCRCRNPKHRRPGGAA